MATATLGRRCLVVGRQAVAVDVQGDRDGRVAEPLETTVIGTPDALRARVGVSNVVVVPMSA
jgi:hypothetical protein